MDCKKNTARLQRTKKHSIKKKPDKKQEKNLEQRIAQGAKITLIILSNKK